ncbi:hypothetical protein OF83DRAFT_1178721 [Amylostereum chailletii]|nr:hypothetical protein OF83DRAFT_1178721 [Amylostereum chailletii]
MGETGAEWKSKGFTRNPIFTLALVISAMAFVRNGATNLFPFLFGLFLEINGMSSRVLSTLSSVGASVSISTIERLKTILSNDARAFAISLMQDTNLFFIIFDNINLYLWKSQQRVFNRNTMIHATNVVVVSIPNADLRGFDLDAKLAFCGKRAAATGMDIIPTPEDDVAMRASFEGVVMQLILSYCPGAKTWKDRKVMLDTAK